MFLSPLPLQDPYLVLILYAAHIQYNPYHGYNISHINKRFHVLFIVCYLEGLIYLFRGYRYIIYYYIYIYEYIYP